MYQKTSRYEKHKYSNEEKLALIENENKSDLINITLGDDSNIFELLQNLGINNLQFTILKFSIFCYFCFYFTFTVYRNILSTVVFMVRKSKGKSNLKANPTRIKTFSFFQPHYYSNSPDYQFLIFFLTTPTIPYPHLL